MFPLSNYVYQPIVLKFIFFSFSSFFIRVSMVMYLCHRWLQQSLIVVEAALCKFSGKALTVQVRICTRQGAIYRTSRVTAYYVSEKRRRRRRRRRRGKREKEKEKKNNKEEKERKKKIERKKERKKKERKKEKNHAPFPGTPIDVKAWTGPEGSRRLSLPYFHTIGT